jgi:hypothetical protein
VLVGRGSRRGVRVDIDGNEMSGCQGRVCVLFVTCMCAFADCVVVLWVCGETGWYCGRDAIRGSDEVLETCLHSFLAMALLGT